jgi:DMSO/TMAO reductase YedYZ molybdopterin-dependent catalytic subunit
MKIRRFIFGIIILSATLLAASGCGITVEEPMELEPEPSELEPVEIREYEGEDLSSINDFRENSIKGPQFVNIDEYSLRVTGLVIEPRDYTYDEVTINHKQFKKVVTLDCVEGWSVTLLWEGVLVRDLIDEAKDLPNAEVIIFKAYDGYTTSLPLEYIMNNDILLAYKMNEVTLPPERGFPFELVAESKWGYKWIKWVTEIELSDDVDYRGFWESRGYSNSADLDDSFVGDRRNKSKNLLKRGVEQ